MLHILYCHYPLKIYAKDKSIAFSIEPVPDVKIYVDENKLQACLINVIKNAVESIDNNGFIKILSSVKDNNLLIAIPTSKDLFSLGDLNTPVTDTQQYQEFLDEISLVSDVEEHKNETNVVTLMTIHSAKGLEFPTVFIVGLEENIFPSPMCTSSMRELEEERRLLYVAITRAEKHCIIT